MNGIFKINTNRLIDILVIFEIIIEIPVTPPSNIVFGIKNVSRA